MLTSASETGKGDRSIQTSSSYSQNTDDWTGLPTDEYKTENFLCISTVVAYKVIQSNSCRMYTASRKTAAITFLHIALSNAKRLSEFIHWQIQQ